MRTAELLIEPLKTEYRLDGHHQCMKVRHVINDRYSIVIIIEYSNSITFDWLSSNRFGFSLIFSYISQDMLIQCFVVIVVFFVI